jgi:3-hydroxyacyl-CoA dehydrogenase
MSLHADKVVAAARNYMGLVEFGVGVIPGGGGSKELAMRASDLFRKNDVELNVLQEYFMTIAMAKYRLRLTKHLMDLLQHGKDIVVVNKTVKLPKLRNMLY